jgi:predicted chitinase
MQFDNASTTQTEITFKPPPGGFFILEPTVTTRDETIVAIAENEQRIAVHEAVCAERYQGIIDSFKRGEKRMQRIANIAYASQYGNGDSSSGDGWAFRGAGLIGLTFHDNFEACGADLHLDLAGEPDRVRTDPALAALVSAWYWSTRGLNVLADAGNFLGITKRINPAMLGSSHRNVLYGAAKQALGVA